MVNFRYHIVSITAVFLALGIGVALGGTFLDRATVDLLESNIDRAEERIRRSDERVGELTDELNRVEQREIGLMEVGGAELFRGLLEDAPVIVLSQPDVDPASLTSVVRNLERADADVRGVLELGTALTSDDQIDTDLANAVSVPVDRPDEVREAVVSAFRQELIDATVLAEDSDRDEEPTGRQGPDSDAGKDGERPPIPSTPPILTALLEGGYLRFTPAEGVEDDATLLESPIYRYVFVGSPEPDELDNDLMLDLLPPSAANAIGAVVVVDTPTEVDEGSVPTVVAEVIADADRTTLYTTVDNVDSFTGLTAMLLAVRDVGVAEPGHYGQAAGASAVLPGDP